MAREPDIDGWIIVAVALVVGLVAGWLIVFHKWNENLTRATAYTVAIFLLLAVALRPAWRRLRLWVDLGVSLALHCVVVLSLMRFLDAHGVRLNWVLALPFVVVELLVLVAVLWRRNVTDASP